MSTSDRRTPLAELEHLVEVGCDAAKLGECEALAREVANLLGLQGVLHVQGRSAVLERILWDVTSEQRVLALKELRKVSREKASKTSYFQVAAAAELLDLTDEAAFDSVKNVRCPHQFDGATWKDLSEQKDNKKLEPKYLRAALWVGRRSARTVGPKRKRSVLLEELLSTIRSYLTEDVDGHTALEERLRNREAIRQLVIGNLDSSRTRPVDQEIGIWRQLRALVNGRKITAFSIAGVLLALSIAIISWSTRNGSSSVSGKGSEASASASQSPTGEPVLGEQSCLARLPQDGDKPEVLEFKLPNGITSTTCPESVLIPIASSTRVKPQVSQYAIQSGANSFHATLHVSSPYPGTLVEFKVSTDNSSETHTLSPGEEKEVSIPVTGAQTVKLTTTIREVGEEAVGYAVWGNAQFEP